MFSTYVSETTSRAAGDAVLGGVHSSRTIINDVEEEEEEEEEEEKQQQHTTTTTIILRYTY